MSRSTGLEIPIFLALAWLLAAPGATQPRAALGESVVDIGPILRGETADQVFEIRNTGSSTLEITDVKPTCGCTVVSYDKTIAPGATGKLTATLSTKGFRGPVAKSIQVYTNDNRNPQLELVIKANVQSYVESDPGYARFLAVRGKGAEPIVQKIWSEEPGEFKILRARSPRPFVNVDFHEASDGERVSGKPGRQWVVEVSLDKSAPEGSFADFVVLQIAHPRLKRMRIPVSGFIQPVVAVLPRIADFGRKDPAKPHTSILEVKNLGEASVSLGEVTSSVAGLLPAVEVVEEGRLYRLRLTLDPTMPKGAFRGDITIPTTSRFQPELVVEVRGTIL